MELESLSSVKPYLLRAHHEWMVDNGLTPHLLVNAELEGVEVPRDFVRDGAIVLNVAPRAVGHLVLGNDAVTFAARFNGVSMPIKVPMDAVAGLVARECNVGISFAELPGQTVAEAGNGEDTVADPPDDTEARPSGGDDPPRGGRPALRIVK